MSNIIPPEVLAWMVPAIALLLALTCAGFALRFVVPGLLLGRDLGTTLHQLQQLQAAGTITPDIIASQAMKSPRLAMVWREYSHTLHLQKATPPTWRATTGAEVFFTDHALVDTPLKTEFYKHLPGILTGIGILGTFSGLILGLSQFAVSSDTSAVRNSLNLLIHSVGHAFQVSAASIALAMLFTWVEKSLVTALYRRVTQLTQTIDGLYEGGSSEEYLARLVQTSETSTRQAAQLREALVEAVRQSIGELAAQQKEAAARDQQQLAGTITQAIAEGLREPMLQLSATIGRSGTDQGQSIAAQIGQTLTRFSATLERRANAEAEAAAQRQNESSAQIGTLLRELTEQIRSLKEEIQRTGSLAQKGAEQVINSSRGVSDHIGHGAGQISAACGELSAASRTVGAMTTQLAESGKRIEQAAQALTAASLREEETLAAHGRLQETLASSLSGLRSTLESARREATLSTDLVSRLESSARQLAQAEKNAETYLAGINAVLGEAHAAFARNMEKTLHEGNRQFQKELAEAVEHLKSTIDELGDTLDAVATRS